MHANALNNFISQDGLIYVAQTSKSLNLNDLAKVSYLYYRSRVGHQVALLHHYLGILTNRFGVLYIWHCIIFSCYGKEERIKELCRACSLPLMTGDTIIPLTWSYLRAGGPYTVKDKAEYSA